MANTTAIIESTMIKRLQWRNSTWTGCEEATMRDLLEFQMKATEGIHVYFLPRIEDMSRNVDMCEKLSAQLGISPLFWTKPSWNANGFFGGLSNFVANPDLGIHGCQFRFLIKTITPKHGATTNGNTPPEYDYDWEYLGFFTLWLMRKSSTIPQRITITKLLLCFDLSERVIENIAAGFQRTALKAEEGPFVLHDILVEIIFIEYEKALWAFQRPVRWYEKNRYDPRNAVDDPGFLTNRYLNMHELARHIIHTSEVLEVAINTLQKMITHHVESSRVWLEDAHSPDCREMLDDVTTQSEALATSRRIHKVNNLELGYLPSDTQNGSNTRLEVILLASAEKIRTGIQLYTCMLESLELRSNAFEKRLQNEIKLAFNSVAADDTRITKRLLREAQRDSNTSREILTETKNLLKESRKDSKSLTKTVSILTLLFLPGTFIAGFFGMQFFGMQNGEWSTSKEIWIYFVVTIPVTIIAMTIWIFSDTVDFSPLLHLGLPRRKITETETSASGIHQNPLGSIVDIDLVQSGQRVER